VAHLRRLCKRELAIRCLAENNRSALPYQEPERLVQIWSTRTTGDFTQMEVSYPDFVDMREHNQVFEQLGGYSMTGATYSGPNGAEQVPTPVANANFFDVLGVRMALGRSFQPDADGAPSPMRKRLIGPIRLELNSVHQTKPGLSHPIACRKESFFRRATIGDL
jgi:hypothetical protein